MGSLMGRESTVSTLGSVAREPQYLRSAPWPQGHAVSVMAKDPGSVALVISDRTLSPQLSHKEDTVLGFRVHRMLPVEFLQAAQVTIYDYYEPCKHG